MESSNKDCTFCEQYHDEIFTDYKPPNNRFKGLAIAAIFGISGAGLLTIAFPFVKPGFRKICLPYVPATDVQVANVLKGLPKKTGSLIDLGSGDGRIVHAAAAQGFTSTGVELNPWLVLYSKLKARTLGVSDKCLFTKRDLWKVNLAEYNNVVIFGVSEMMPSLEKKLIQDLDSSNNEVRVVACRFPLAKKEPIQVIGSGIDSVWVYDFKRSN
ncbi:hypothetical protein HDE_13806 [Halotydeus destructor]|nr:hypothetical protein HDE_13806 [Halotydeus destructor]